jgi:hypothetical protein
MHLMQFPRVVIAHGGPRVGVRGSFLHISERNACIECGGDGRVSQGVRSYVLGDPGPAGRPADDPGGRAGPAVSRQAARKIGPSVRSPMARSMARAVRGASGIVTTLPPLRVITRVRWPRSTPRASMSAPVASDNAQPVERQEGDQRVLGGQAEPGCDKQRAELVAVQAGGMGLIVQPGPAHVRGRRVVEELFLDGVAVESGDGAQPAGDGGTGAAAGFPGRGRSTRCRRGVQRTGGPGATGIRPCTGASPVRKPAG